MQEAIHLAKMSKDCETDNRGKQFSDGEFWNHHRAYVVGSIMISIACIEAQINEFYATALDGYSSNSAHKKISKYLIEII
ncbi:MAG: hypothetical protein D3916_18255 [Candidatus Electrothrix sp. MAN1_4]|nr:hypothetical protein [Candidatus Electrothrix sp. MAN1_4]